MALLILIAAIMIGMSYLYLSADMMTPQFASTPETDRVIRKDSLRQYGGNYLRHSESGLWELKVSGPAYERGKAIGQLTSDLLYFQEKVFVDQIKDSPQDQKQNVRDADLPRAKRQRLVCLKEWGGNKTTYQLVEAF